MVTPEDMRLDLDELFYKLEMTHPNLYAYRAKASVDLDRQRLSDELTQAMTVIDFYKKAALLINSLADYHTRLSLSREALVVIEQSERFFPFGLQIEGQRAYINANFSGDDSIKFGTELLEVNGMPVSEILDRSKQYEPFGRNISPITLWLLFGSMPDYQLNLLPPGKTTVVNRNVPGLTSVEIRQLAIRDEFPASVTYTKLPDIKGGLLAINTFVDIAKLLEPAFTRIQEDAVQHLIIDIRANEGGQYDQVDWLMDYLTDQPYKQCSRGYVAPATGSASAEPIETVCALKHPFDFPQRYAEKIYLLIGPDTSSAAVTFATILQDYNLAVLIGEETLTPASYCGDIAEVILTLPQTQLSYMVPRTCYVRPSGIFNEDGVIPDIIVNTTFSDRIAGKDPVLVRTLELIPETP